MRLPPPPWIAAHRGALPLLENTVPALELAIAEGADLLEFDVQATADDVLVLHHDADLGRLGGRADRTIQTARAQELLAAGLRHPLHPERTGRIPTLHALLRALPRDFPVNIELKAGAREHGRTAALALEATAGRANVLFSSFEAGLLRELRRRSPSARLAPIADFATPDFVRLGEEIGAWSLHVGDGGDGGGAARAGPESLFALVAETSLAACPILFYTVNSARRARDLLALGATGLFTDRPGPLRAELGQASASGVLSRTYRGR